MKYMLLIGGLLGFSLVFVAGWMAGRDALTAVIEGSIGCVVAAMLFRWLGRIYQQSVRAVVREREAASHVTPETTGADPISNTQN
jgi:hypothetical protein